jgi:hypothetical protein
MAMSKRSVVVGALLAAASPFLMGNAAAVPVTWTDWLTISSPVALGNMGGVTVTATAPDQRQPGRPLADRLRNQLVDATRSRQSGLYGWQRQQCADGMRAGWTELGDRHHCFVLGSGH